MIYRRHFAVLSCFPNIPRLRIVVVDPCTCILLHCIGNVRQQIDIDALFHHKESNFTNTVLNYAFDGSAPPLLLALDALSGLSPRTASRYLLR